MPPHLLISLNHSLRPQAILLVCLISGALACAGLAPSRSPTTEAPASSPRPPAFAGTPATVAPALTVDSFLARCPTTSEVASIDAHVEMSFGHFVAFPTVTLEPDGSMTFGQTIYGSQDPLVCFRQDGSADLDALQLRAYQSLLIMRQLAFDEPLPWTRQSLYDWFVGAVHELRFEEGPGIEYSECCNEKGVVQLASMGVPVMSASRWIDPSSLGPQGLFYPHARIHAGMQAMIATLVHLARANELGGHLEGCPEPWQEPGNGVLGPWGAEFAFLVWISEHSSGPFLTIPGEGPEFYRRIAFEDAETILNGHFCGSPPSAGIG